MVKVKGHKRTVNGRTSKFRIGNRIYVGGLGNAIITKPNAKDSTQATYVLEEDNTKSFQMLPDENSDIFLKNVWVRPLEKKSLEAIRRASR